jgi:hypothetical protein
MRIEKIQLKKRDKIETWDAIVIKEKKMRISKGIAREIKEKIEYRNIITIVPCLFIKEKDLIIDKETTDLLIIIPTDSNKEVEIFPKESAELIAQDEEHSIFIKKNDHNEVIVSYFLKNKNQIALISKNDYYAKETLSPVHLNESLLMAMKKLSIMNRFRSKTEEEKKISRCVLRGNIFLLNEDIIIHGDKYSTKAIIFENAEIFPVNTPPNQKILTSGNRKFLYITTSKDSKEIDPKKESLYSSPNSKYYENYLTTYHYKDKLYPDPKDNETMMNIIDSGKMEDNLLIDITDEEIENIKIKVKKWKYKSESYFSIESKKDFSNIWDLELIEEKEVYLKELIGNKKTTCKELMER